MPGAVARQPKSGTLSNVVAGAAAARPGPRAAVGAGGLLGMTTAAVLAPGWVRQRDALTGEPSGDTPAAVRQRES
jgi:hypothetical protein